MSQLVLFLHGVGSNGADLRGLVPLFASVLPKARFLSPDAPLPFDGGGNGRQWFSIAGVTEANRPSRVQAARAALDAMIDAAGAEEVILIGFSQGSIMALDALARGKVAKVVAFAGRLAFTEPLTPQPGASALLVGGLADHVMPARLTTEAAQRLKEAGVAVEEILLPGVPHTITSDGIAAAQAFLARA